MSEQQKIAQLEREIANLRAQLEIAQNELAQSEKVACLGNLVSGVAHQINTPLGNGITASSHLSDEIARFSKKCSSTNISEFELANFVKLLNTNNTFIVQNLERAADLIRSFKLIAIDQSSEDIRQVNLLEYAWEVITSLQHHLRNKNINIKVDIAEELTVTTFPGIFAQILSNFITNSYTHAFTESDSGSITLSATEDEDLLHFTYQDNGCGMDQETAKHVFDPIFTTKQASGRGLGMNIVYHAITQKLKGKISCTSTLGKGTKFDIILPSIVAN